MGGSLASISMRALSTPMPGERGEHVLDGVHLDVALGDGGGALDGFDVFDLARRSSARPARSLRLNLRPRPGGAGWMVRVTFSPVCSEVPAEAGAFGEGVLKRCVMKAWERSGAVMDTMPADKPLVAARASVFAFDGEKQRVDVFLVARAQPRDEDAPDGDEQFERRARINAGKRAQHGAG